MTIRNRRAVDKLKERLTSAIIPVIVMLVLWFVRLEVSRNMINKRLDDLEIKEGIRWTMIDKLKMDMAEVVLSSESHGKEANKDISNAKERICDLRKRIYRVEERFMNSD